MATHAGTKRPHPSTVTGPHPPPSKRPRQRVHHRPQHVQERPQHIEPASQDAFFIQGQLMRSITAASSLAGFDSIKPAALEMFRAATEEYLLRLSHHVRQSMLHGRRTLPTVTDVATALALAPNTRTPSQLLPQLALNLPSDISAPVIEPPSADESAPPDLRSLLEPLMPDGIPAYIPQHFPSLPPHHAWKSTAVWPTRERDSRQMRENATREGQLAEQALRKLAAAAKQGAVKEERRRRRERVWNALAGRDGGAKTKRGLRYRGASENDADIGREETYGDVLKEFDGATDDAEALEVQTAGAIEDQARGIDGGMAEGVVVNHTMQHWRKGSSRKALAL